MVILILAILLGIAFLVWLWKVPIKNMVKAMKKGGSSTFEAYTVIILVACGVAGAIYMILRVV